MMLHNTFVLQSATIANNLALLMENAHHALIWQKSLLMEPVLQQSTIVVSDNIFKMVIVLILILSVKHTKESEDYA
jgi:hypothetical protein